MTNHEGEKAYAQQFQFFDFVPSRIHEELRDYLYKFSYNLSEAYEYIQIAKLSHEMEFSQSTPLLFRIHIMALQCFALSIRKMTDDISDRSLQKLIKLVPQSVPQEDQEDEIMAIKDVHEHYRRFLNKFVAHQDKHGVGKSILEFPDTDVIDEDLIYLQDLYERIVTKMCKTYIGVTDKTEDYSVELSRLGE